ncbi:hypothetical protein BDN71DRAFT_594448 [Pleurotus eryngii]|uniref:Uncharacterized protein n=1 Tax=Pleurotus eryngii TaxID=5323 RepID=A0A9P6A0A6_PLEER|nr:hypothetical protein BDN71DRAFT_594448 [Pleurotus eryngii]
MRKKVCLFPCNTSKRAYRRRAPRIHTYTLHRSFMHAFHEGIGRHLLQRWAPTWCPLRIRNIFESSDPRYTHSGLESDQRRLFMVGNAVKKTSSGSMPFIHSSRENPHIQMGLSNYEARGVSRQTN